MQFSLATAAPAMLATCAPRMARYTPSACMAPLLGAAAPAVKASSQPHLASSSASSGPIRFMGGGILVFSSP